MSVVNDESVTQSDERVRLSDLGGRVDALDGLRAVAIGLVLFKHLLTSYVPSTHALQVGDLGVQLFFVLSGFLITGILVREKANAGAIGLKNFYVRRALRIWPAYYVFLGVVAALSLAKIIDVSTGSWVSSALFVANYSPFHDSPPWLGHTWSLAVEEQFYLLWPFVLVLLRPAQALRVALALVLLGPFLRVATYAALDTEEQRRWIFAFFHTRADSLATGAALALTAHVAPDALARAAETARRYRLARVSIAAISLSIVIAYWSPGARPLVAGYSLANVGIAVVVLVALIPSSSLARRLRQRPLVWVGGLSYSLYLWQQLFTIEGVTGWLRLPLVSLPTVFLLAWLSKRFVEQPALRLKGRYAPRG